MPSSLSFKAALSPGCRIGVMAPSSYVDRDRVEASARLMEERGYNVFIHPQTFERNNQSAGTILQKSLALQGLMKRDDIDVVWFAGGGNHSMELLGALNFDNINKPVLGYSDNTALLNAVMDRCGLVSFHAPVFAGLSRMETEHFDDLLTALSFDHGSLAFDAVQVWQDGEAEGRFIGGNLSLFQYLPSLLSDGYLNDAILCLEDCREEYSLIDRTFSFLRQSGVLGHIRGLLLGQFTDLTDSGRPFGLSLHDIVMTHMDGYKVPIIYDLPFGHDIKVPFYPLPIGGFAKISCDSSAIDWGVCQV